MASLVVYDLEFTTWEGAVEGDWSAPGQLREIVQIGAVRLDEALAVQGEFEVLVKPVVNPRLSSYFVELTGVRQEDVDRDGVPPADALGRFLGFCRGETALSYGNDMVVLGENAGWARARGEALDHGLLTTPFLNIRPWLNALAPATATANSGRLWKVLGLPRPTDGAEHSALFDARSVAAALRHLRANGHALPAGCR
ncbi:Inhibitor of the KinA pathway to sporulation, predicted exonuclease [Streptomyces zhaozhouensis]|uniref:Inhibitor of the KinA pathway to sporulation, predicted exonuclease n=1 Tax=Streptomyces zhaozhouensis TaxID=1300267 RepID=A0A286E090_9ACTN|nr:3'-5' exonuclease [Streptomyces zhaozhouensis]SOD64336.1 Inhibitor of the KinA pathway to sporulation, predicted exonuclease [Streptomyces zhaozhouensis]